MDFEKLIDSLARFGCMLPAVVDGISDRDARWRPDEGGWSILEVVCHLADEEEYDFRTRVSLTLTDPNKEWPPIDPEGWALERSYNQQSFGESLERFTSLRRESVAWLRRLKNPDWMLTHAHPKFGPFRAGDILASWVAHDYLHLRQIAKRMYELANRDAGEFSSRYAGDWSA